MTSDALSLSRTELPEEIEKAIAEVVATQQAFAGMDLHPSNREAWKASLSCSGALEALTAAILSRLGEAEARREEVQGAPFGTGSCPGGPNPSVSGHSACDPSRERMRQALLRIVQMQDASDMQTEAQETIDSLPETKTEWLALLSSPSPSECYEAASWASRYLYDRADAEVAQALAARNEVESNKTVRAVIRSAFRGAPQGTEARSAETERLGPKDDGPVAEGHAPALTAALARVERLEKALEPFAEAADNLEGNEREDQHLWESPEAMMLSVGDLRAARSALSEAPPQGEQ